MLLRAKGCYIKFMDNLGDLLLEYFSVEPQSIVVTDKDDKHGRPITLRTPNDLPTPAGFCSRHGISERKLAALVGASPELIEIAEVCKAKMKYFMQVNGLTKGAWEQTAWSLMAKNELGYAEKTEVTQTVRRELQASDLQLLADLGLRVVQPQVKVING